MSAGTDGDFQIVPAGELDGPRHVVLARTPHDRGGQGLGARIPVEDPAGGGITVVIGHDESAGERVAQGGKGVGVDPRLPCHRVPHAGSGEESATRDGGGTAEHPAA